MREQQRGEYGDGLLPALQFKGWKGLRNLGRLTGRQTSPPGMMLNLVYETRVGSVDGKRMSWFIFCGTASGRLHGVLAPVYPFSHSPFPSGSTP